MSSKAAIDPALQGSDSEFDSSNEDVKDVKGKGKGVKERKTRSSKACKNTTVPPACPLDRLRDSPRPQVTSERTFLG